MTGGEFAAAAAAKAAKAVLGEDDSTKNAIVAAARDTEGFQKAAELRGRRLAAKEQAVLNLFKPLYRLVGVSKEYFEGEFTSDLAAKLEDVPEEQRGAPSAPLAVQAMQGLSWSVDEPDLKEMYLNLLATATDTRRSSNAHPSFAEVIKQLSPDEARLLNNVLPGIGHDGVPMVRLRLIVNTARPAEGYKDVGRHILDLSDVDTGVRVVNPMLGTWVDNWVRLGLVEPDYGSRRVAPDAYNWAELRPEVIRLRAKHDTESSRIDVQHGLLRLTDFGLRFKLAVLAPRRPAVISTPKQRD